MKKKVILLFVALLILNWYMTISESINRPKQLAEHLNRAEELEGKEIYLDAITEYESAAALTEDTSEIYLKMAQDYLKCGNAKKFINLCKQVAEEDQDDTAAMDMLMEYYVDNGYEGKAASYLSTFTETYPNNENAQKWFLTFQGSYNELYVLAEEMSEIHNETCVVLKEGLYGLISSTGSEILSAQYKELGPLSSDGFILTKNAEDKYMYIDTDGLIRIVPDGEYTELGLMESGYAVACRNGKYGYITEKGEEAFEATFDQLTGLKNKVGAACVNGKWALINEKGNTRTDYIYDDVIQDIYGICSNQGIIFVKESGSYHMVNKKGKNIGELTFDDAKAFSTEGYAAVCKNGLWGFVNSDGELMIDYAYEDAKSFSNGFAAVYENGYWGYIDAENHMVIDPQFLEATDISAEGSFTVLKEDLDEADGKGWKLAQLNVFK